VANPIGIDVGEFNFNFDPESKMVLSLSKLSPRKRVCDLVEAWASVEKQRPEAKLVIAGSGPNGDSLRRLAQDLSLERIEFLGYVNETKKKELFQKAAIFVSPTLYEGFGLTNLEAMVSGCVVVSTETWGVKDYIRDAENGFQVPIRDPPSIAETVLDLLGDTEKRKRIAKQGAETASNYTISRSLDRESEFLDRLAKTGPSV
jgi:glycosyltransferase involved in cell wall biosynthesis